MSSLYGNFKDIILMTWPTLFISLVVFVSIRITYLVKNKEEFVLYKEMFLLMFVLYILCLFQVVTSQDVNILEGNNFTPFKEILRYEFGSSYFIKNILGNVIMFVPYGFFVGKFASQKNTKLTIFLLFLASLSIEVTQLLIGRVFDVDDILLNVVGGMLGYLLFRFFDQILSILPKFCRTKTFYNIASVIGMALFALAIINILLV